MPTSAIIYDAYTSIIKNKRIPRCSAQEKFVLANFQVFTAVLVVLLIDPRVAFSSYSYDPKHHYCGTLATSTRRKDHR